MPLTPRFELSQTESEVVVQISVPTVRVTNIEVFLEDSSSTFHFHASPYLLKLHFAPHQFAEDSHGNVPAEYDPALQKITVRLNKAQPYSQWPNLDLTARLLQPKEIPSRWRWLHAVQDSHELQQSEQLQPDAAAAAAAANTEAHGEAPCDAGNSDGYGYGYGFGGLFKNIFTDYCRGGLAQEMLQLPDPESTSVTNRRILRVGKEAADFDEDRYAQDWYIQEDYLYPMVMEFKPFWSNSACRSCNVESDSDNAHDHGSEPHSSTAQHSDEGELSTQLEGMHLEKVKGKGTTTASTTSTRASFTSDETLQLATIPYPLLPDRLLDFREDSNMWPGLLDLLVPFAYDHLTTMADPTVESAWTITTLSASLSWLDPPTTVEEAVRCSTRRTLIYPYWRNYQFSLHVWNNVLSILESGVHAVVKSLLMTRNILEKSESYYVGNKLFVDPFLYWIQKIDGTCSSIPKGFIKAVKHELRSSELLKIGLGLSLESIELEHSREGEDQGSNNDCASYDDDDDSSSSASSSATTSTSSDDSTQKVEITTGNLLDIENGKPDTITSAPVLLDSIVGDHTSILEIVGEQESNEEAEHGHPVKAKSGSRLLIEEL